VLGLLIEEGLRVPLLRNTCHKLRLYCLWYN